MDLSDTHQIFAFQQDCWNWNIRRPDPCFEDVRQVRILFVHVSWFDSVIRCLGISAH